jgi:hypothetical protein
MTNESIRELAEGIYRGKVLRARELSVAERIETGIELFENAVEIMKSGIRMQFPVSTDDDVETILRQRLNRLRQIHEHGLYRRNS